MNRVLREGVTGGWRRMHKEELHDLNCSPNITRAITFSCMKCVGHVACKGSRRNVYRILVGKAEGKIPLEKRSHNWEDNINSLTPNDSYSGRTAPLTSKRCILYIYSTNIWY